MLWAPPWQEPARANGRSAVPGVRRERETDDQQEMAITNNDGRVPERGSEADDGSQPPSRDSHGRAPERTTIHTHGPEGSEEPNDRRPTEAKENDGALQEDSPAAHGPAPESSGDNDDKAEIEASSLHGPKIDRGAYDGGPELVLPSFHGSEGQPTSVYGGALEISSSVFHEPAPELRPEQRHELLPAERQSSEESDGLFVSESSKR
jgi:hypothetical protein